MLVPKVSLNNNYQNKKQTNFKGINEQIKFVEFLNLPDLQKVLKDSSDADNAASVRRFFCYVHEQFTKFIKNGYDELPEEAVFNGKVYKSKINPAEKVCIAITENGIEYVERESIHSSVKDYDIRNSIVYYLDKTVDGKPRIVKEMASAKILEKTGVGQMGGPREILDVGEDSFKFVGIYSNPLYAPPSCGKF